jgi:hypothetical protein
MYLVEDTGPYGTASRKSVSGDFYFNDQKEAKLTTRKRKVGLAKLWTAGDGKISNLFLQCTLLLFNWSF